MVELSIASNRALSIFGTRETVSINSRPTLGLEGTFPDWTSSMYFKICDRQRSIVSAALREEGRGGVSHVTGRRRVESHKGSEKSYIIVIPQIITCEIRVNGEDCVQTLETCSRDAIDLPHSLHFRLPKL